jgi:hypothetical protein
LTFKYSLQKKTAYDRIYAKAPGGATAGKMPLSVGNNHPKRFPELPLLLAGAAKGE